MKRICTVPLKGTLPNINNTSSVGLEPKSIFGLLIEMVPTHWHLLF
jgi:hypothetical protein